VCLPGAVGALVGAPAAMHASSSGRMKPLRIIVLCDTASAASHYSPPPPSRPSLQPPTGSRQSWRTATSASAFPAASSAAAPATSPSVAPATDGYVPHQPSTAAGTVEVSFCIEYGTPGATTLHLSGDAARLGGWQLANAVKMEWLQGSYFATVRLPAG